MPTIDNKNKPSPIFITFKEPTLSESSPDGKARAPKAKKEIKAKEVVSAFVRFSSDLIKGKSGARVKVIACVIVWQKEAKYKTLFLDII
jgi:hypothetical protein